MGRVSEDDDLQADREAGARAAFARIGTHARQANLDRVDELAELLRAPSGRLGDDARRLVGELAHALTGSAGTFGWERVSERARELERLFAEDGGRPTVARACELLTEIRSDLESDPERSPAHDAGWDGGMGGSTTRST